VKVFWDNINVLTPILTLVAAVFISVALYAAFFIAPQEAVMGLPQKIFYFHVPIATLCYLGFFVTFVGSLGYLWSKKPIYDIWAQSGAEIGVMLATLTLITGMLWGRPIWGVYWTWDPRLTTSLVLWLTFVGYLILRSRVDDPILRAKYAAVIGVVGYVNVPLVHYSIKLWARGIHPPKPELHPDMAKALMVCFVAHFLLFCLIFILRIRTGLLEAKVLELKGER